MTTKQPGDVIFEEVLDQAARIGQMGLRVVVFQEEGLWVAQVLEHDINAQGASVEEAKRNLADVLLSSIALDMYLGKEPLCAIGPAPDWYWRLWVDERAETVESAPGEIATLSSEAIEAKMPAGVRVCVAA